MTHVTYTDLRQNLAHYLDEAINSRAPVFVTRRRGKGNVVLMSEEEFSSWQETCHLLSSPENARRLMESIQELEEGKSEEHELIYPDVLKNP